MAFDPVNEYDKDIEQWAKEGRSLMAEVTPKMAPHRIGTKRVSRENVKYDYDNRGPDYWPQRFDEVLERASTEGKNIGWAVIEVLKHDKDMTNGPVGRESDATPT